MLFGVQDTQRCVDVNNKKGQILHELHGIMPSRIVNCR